MNFTVFVIGIILIVISIYNFCTQRNAIFDVIERWNCNDVTVTLPVGTQFSFKARGGDRKIAWDVYVQIKTRIASVDFRKGEDSLFHVNKSLHELFQYIREKIQNLPLETISKREDNPVEFYFSILNDGLRPYLTKWHVPVSHFHKKMEGSGKSAIEIDKEFIEANPEIISDITNLNKKMAGISKSLYRIAKGESFCDKEEEKKS